MLPALAALTLAATPSVSVAGAFLAGRDGCGAAMLAGARLAVDDSLAFGLDAGHGASRATDRFWVIPTAAFVLPVGPLRVDLGAGVGLAAWTESAPLPDLPDPQAGLFPAIRAHVRAALPIARGLSFFGRVDAEAFSRSGNLWLGLELDLS